MSVLKLKIFILFILSIALDKQCSGLHLLFYIFMSIDARNKNLKLSS